MGNFDKFMRVIHINKFNGHYFIIWGFSTNIYKLFFKTAKISIQKVIKFGWVRIQKDKLCGKTLKAYQV